MRPLALRAYHQLVKPFAGLGLRRFRAVQALHMFVARNVAGGRVQIQGDTLFLDRLDTLGLAAFGTYDPVATRLLTQQVRSGDVALDVGAHIGYYTLLLARLVGPHGRVFAFEPEPENFALLQRNVMTNGLTNINLIEKAVSDKRGKVRLYLSSQNLGDHRIYDPGDEARVMVDVECLDLNHFFRAYKREINFVKLDIQGAELAAIHGMSVLLERFPAIKLFLEYWPSGLKAFGTEPETLLELLDKRGFALYDVNEVAGQVTRTTIAKLLQTYRPELNNATNLFCVRALAELAITSPSQPGKR